MKWREVATAGLLLGLLNTAQPASPPINHETQLKSLRERIKILQVQLNKTRGQRDSVREEVRVLERDIGAIIGKLRRLKTHLKTNQRKLERLHAQTNEEKGKLRAHVLGLEHQARAAYLLGRQEYLKLLLNQEDPSRLSRTLAYYRYFHRARVKRIDGIQTTLARMTTLEEEIRAHSRELKELRTSQIQMKTQLEDAREHRAELLTQLNREIRDRSKDIGALREDEERLERLLQELQDYLPDIPPLPGREAHFGNNKGRLPLPTHGAIVARFGEQKRIGDLKWRGIFIAGREGQDIRSVFRGRVAYADWLRGFGLLLILDHGNGYMTLYGHNQSLYIEIGDWVEAGQVVASLGNTGDVPRPGLYFEIRHNGKPHNPLRWCKVRARKNAANNPLFLSTAIGRRGKAS